MERKECFKCRRYLPLSEFYRHPQMTDGHLGKCKDCTKRDVSENYRLRLAKYKEYYKARDKKRKAYIAERQRRYRSNNPDKYRAHKAVSNAVRDGRLLRQKCEVCGDTKSQAHHDDYSKPLEVRWLCKLHHDQVHGKQLSS